MNKPNKTIIVHQDIIHKNHILKYMHGHIQILMIPPVLIILYKFPF